MQNPLLLTLTNCTSDAHKYRLGDGTFQKKHIKAVLQKLYLFLVTLQMESKLLILTSDDHCSAR